MSRQLLRPIATTALVATAALLLAGCGGRGQSAEPSRSPSAQTGPTAPAYDAPAEVVGEFVAGNWRVMLLPEAASTDVDAPTVQADLQVGEFYDSTDGLRVANLSGMFGGSEVTSGQLAVTPGGGQSPELRFTTSELTVPSLTGDEQKTVPGPIEWTAVLYDGSLIGEATGTDGNRSAWEATRQ